MTRGRPSLKVVEASFLLGAPTLSGLSHFDLPEVAVLGRSNVGKSTLINRLTNRRNLARTSSTPGRTQEINLFKVDFSDGSRARSHIILADLPGFGFAKVAKTKREELSRNIVEYLTEREELSEVVLLNDCRRPPERDELAVQRISADTGVNLLIVLTKCDKLSKNEFAKQRKLIAGAYGLEPQDLATSGEKEDYSELWARILGVL